MSPALLRIGRIAAGVIALVASTAAAEPTAPIFPAPPRLAITAAELARQKGAVDFPARRAAAIAAADPLVATPVTLPDGVGSWYFYYACPDDGATLRAVSPAEHECPTCRKRYGDERTVAAYRGILHGQAEAAALTLAWAYAYADDDAYAAQVKRILVKLADDYPGYPPRIDRWNRTGIFAPLGGRRRVQSLDEATGVIALAKAYDLTRAAAVWNDAERRHVEDDFFRLTAQTLRFCPMGRENRQAWYNAGLIAIGAALADAALVDQALRGPSGFAYQLEHGVGDDGLWWEGTMAYQFYAVQPLIETVDIARRLGIPLQDHPRFRALLSSPLRATYPDGAFPCINDSDPASYHLFDPTFAWAWETYRDPIFAQALAWRDPPRLQAMLGADAVAACPLDVATADLASIGLLFLRVGSGAEAVCVTHHYGAPGGDATGHGHFDKLAITLFANGREWLADIGRIGYTHKEYKSWARRTIAHNTVAIDQKDQAIDTGRLLWLDHDADHAACASESTHAYPGVTLRRWLYLERSLLIDVVEVSAEQPRTIDLAAHAISGPLVAGDGLTAKPLDALGADNGWQHLRDIRAFAPGADSSWVFPSLDDPAQRLRVHLAHAPDERVFAAIGVGYAPTQAAPCLIRRRVGASARFACVYDLSRDGAHVAGIDAIEGPTPHVIVRTSAGALDVRFGTDGVTTSVVP